MTLKIVAAFVLLAWLAVPLLVGAWMVFPLTAGAVLWALWRFSGRPVIGTFLKPLLLVVLLAFVAWLLWIPKFTVPPASYASGTAHAAIQAALGGGVPAPTGDESLVRERQDFASAVARARQKVNTIATALQLYSSADAVSVNRNSRGLDDQAGLRPALEALRTALQSQPLDNEGHTPNLLDPQELDALLASVRAAIDGHEQKAEASSASVENLRALRLGILGLLAPFRVDSLYAAVSSVESALRNTLRVEVPIDARYRAGYDRGRDELIAEQQVIMRIANLQVRAIDLCGFLPGTTGANANGELVLNLDGLQERTIEPQDCHVDTRGAKQQLIVTKRSRKSDASRPILTDRLWMPFRAVSVTWPLPLLSSAVLTLAFPDDATLTWPLTVPVETPLETPLEFVSIPRNSFYYASPPMQPNEQGDLLVPDAGTPRISALATGAAIDVELLPWYLSNTTGQKYKQYVASENLVAALVVALVTSLIAAVMSPKPAGPGVHH